MVLFGMTHAETDSARTNTHIQRNTSSTGRCGFSRKVMEEEGGKVMGTKCAVLNLGQSGGSIFFFSQCGPEVL